MNMIMAMDLSVLGSAYVCLPPNWKPGDWDSLGVYQRISVAGLDGFHRVTHIVRHLEEIARSQHVVFPFTEQYAFGASSSSVTKLAELGGAMKYMFEVGLGLTVQPLVASHARKLMFGKLPRMNRQMWKEFVTVQLQKMGAPFGENDDLCDAFLVANAGLSELGKPCLSQ